MSPSQGAALDLIRELHAMGATTVSVGNISATFGPRPGPSTVVKDDTDGEFDRPLKRRDPVELAAHHSGARARNVRELWIERNGDQPWADKAVDGG